MTDTSTFLSIDLDEERSRRAAAREVQSDTLPIRFGGEVIAEIPTELPLDVLAPLRRLDDEITLLLRSMMTVMNKSREEQDRWDATSLIIDVLAANPALPSTVLDVINDMGERLFGAEGFAAFLAARPTSKDAAFLAGRLLSFYGLTLGESRPSSTSSSERGEGDGTTSTLTSSTTTEDSTSEESGSAPETPASSEPAAS